VSFLDVIFLKEFWFVIFEYVILGCVISGSVVFNILFPNSFASEFDSSWFIRVHLGPPRSAPLIISANFN